MNASFTLPPPTHGPGGAHGKHAKHAVGRHQKKPKTQSARFRDIEAELESGFDDYELGDGGWDAPPTPPKPEPKHAPMPPPGPPP